MLHKLCLIGVFVATLITPGLSQGCTATYNKISASFVPGGSPQPYTSLTACQNACALNASCTAIDWDSSQASTKQCYFFTTNVVGQSILASLVSSTWIIDHYDLTSRTNCGGSGPGGVTNSAGSGGGSGGGNGIVGGLPSSLCTAQWATYPNSNVAGGLMDSSTSLAQCQSDCFNEPTCTGVDYDTNNPVGEQCYIIFTTGLTKTASSSSVTHYDITRICPLASTAYPLSCPPAFQPHQNVTVYGGTPYSAAPSPEVCKATCAGAVQCFGVVFDTSAPPGQQCNLLLAPVSAQVGGPVPQQFVPKLASWLGVTYYKRVPGQCGGCNSWVITSNMHLLGGVANPAVSPSACQTVCGTNTLNYCYSVDFDNTQPVGNQCFLLYTPTTNAAGASLLAPSSGVDHYERGSCAGTGVPPTVGPNPNQQANLLNANV